MINVIWSIRIILLIILFGNWIFFTFLLKNRAKYAKIVENKQINTIEVIIYNLCCYLSVGLIPSSNPIIDKFSSWGLIPFVFAISGIIFVIMGIQLTLKTFKQRKAIGIQNTPSGLIISGPYKIARHPIYLGIIWISGGLGLLLLNIDGIMVLPLVILVNFLEGKSEEKFDLIKRFGQDYIEYQKQIQILGPFKFWLGFIIWIGIFFIWGFSVF